MRPCFNVQTSMYSPLEVDIPLCAKVGFHDVEISFAKADAYLENHSLKEMNALLKEYDMNNASINAIFGTSFAEGAEWERVKGQFLHACEIGEAIGTDRVIVLASERADLPEGVTREEIHKNTIVNLNRLADIGLDYGMKVAFEPVGTMAIGSQKEAHELVKSINRPNEIGHVVDAFNMFVYDLCSDMDDIAGFDKTFMYMVHLNDAEPIPNAWIDQDHRCMPGDGRIDVKRYMQNVKATGYDGPVSVEILNSGLWKSTTPEDLVQQAYDKCMALL